MAKKLKASARMDAEWNKLRLLIINFAGAKVDESWKGGGDPADHEVIEVSLVLAQAQLEAQINKMRREYDL